MTDRRPSNDRGYEVVMSPILREESGMSGMPDQLKNSKYLKFDGSEKRIRPLAGQLSPPPDYPDAKSFRCNLPNIEPSNWESLT